MKRSYHLRTERWKPVKGYEGLYEWSNKGQVRSCGFDLPHFRGGMRHRNGVILKHQVVNGYHFVVLTKNGNHKRYSIHRLIGLNFCKIPEHLRNIPLEELQIDHIDGNKNNNCVWNLRWVTAGENRNNPNTKDKCSLTQINGRDSKKIRQFTLDGVFVKEWFNVRDVERTLGWNHNNISKCCRKVKHFNTAYGYRWEYA